MKSCARIIVAVILVVMVMDDVTGYCCRSTGGWWWQKEKCSDCTYGTPCCAYGKCNMFCCNCDGGGCRKGGCGRKRSFLEHPVNPAKVFSAIDVNGDSVVDKDEFYERANEVPWPAKSTRGLSDDDFLITEFEKMDKNGDGMISPGEFDADLK